MIDYRREFILERRRRHYRFRRTVRLAIAVFVSIALLIGWYLYAQAGDLQVQLLRGGQPVAGESYTLEGLPTGNELPNGLITGKTDADGMIIATGIATGTWQLSAPCVLVDVEVGEVNAQVLQQVDAACRTYVPRVTK